MAIAKKTDKAPAAAKKTATAAKSHKDTKAAAAPSADDKKSAEAVAAFLAEARKLGVQGDVNKQIDLVSSGNWIIDRLLGDGTGSGAPGGIPRGGIVEIFGNESCGKTTLALHFARTCQAAGGIVVFVDYERSLRFQQHYLRSLGIDTDPSKFIVLEPNDFEQGNLMIGKAVITLKPHLVIVDSWAAAVPAQAMEAGADEGTRMGLHAAITSQVLPRFAKWLKASNSAMIILNQMRKNIKQSKYDPGPDEITTGGNAIRYYPTQRIEMRSQAKESIEVKSGGLTGVDEKKAVNQTIKVIVAKNKLDVPWKSSPVFITFGKGIDGLRSLIELGVNRGVISKGGSWFEYQSLTNPACSFKRAGKEQVYQYMVAHPEVVQDLMPNLLPKVDTEELKKAVKEGAIEKGDLDNLDTGAMLGAELDDELAAELAELDKAQSSVSVPGEAPDLSDI